MAVTQLTNGNIVVAYVSSGAHGEEGPVFTIIDQNGDEQIQNESAQQFDIAGNASPPKIVALDNGEFFLVWATNGSNDGELKGRFFNADGSAASDEIDITHGIANNYVDSADGFDVDHYSVVAHGTDEVIVSWVSANDGSGTGVMSTIVAHAPPPCFCPGTMIRTVRGNVAVEDLKIGDQVFTRDSGYQEVRWIGSTKVSARGKNAPIRCRKGVLGNDKDLWLSPNHRVLCTGTDVALMFGINEALVAIKHLTHLDGIDAVSSADQVEYFHIMFDFHEIVSSDAAWSESLFWDEDGLYGPKGQMKAMLSELRGDARESNNPVLARPELKKFEAHLISSPVRSHNANRFTHSYLH